MVNHDKYDQLLAIIVFINDNWDIMLIVLSCYYNSGLLIKQCLMMIIIHSGLLMVRLDYYVIKL